MPVADWLQNNNNNKTKTAQCWVSAGCVCWLLYCNVWNLTDTKYTAVQDENIRIYSINREEKTEKWTVSAERTTQIARAHRYN